MFTTTTTSSKYAWAVNRSCGRFRARLPGRLGVARVDDGAPAAEANLLRLGARPAPDHEPEFRALEALERLGRPEIERHPAAVVDLDLVPGAAARPERRRALELERRESARRVELPPEPVDGNRDPGLVEADIAIVRLRGCDRGQLLCPSLLPASEVEHDTAALVALQATLEDELEHVRRAPGDPGARLTDLPVHESIPGRERERPPRRGLARRLRPRSRRGPACSRLGLLSDRGRGLHRRSL